MNEAQLLLFESINRGQRFIYNVATVLYTFCLSFAYLYIYARGERE